MRLPIVQKFGGSSLETPSLRNIAVDRVLEAIQGGHAPVVVVSAFGRSPQPYATDTLAALMPAHIENANRDLVLSCGELISAGVFANLLVSRGFRAAALTGADAGIITNAKPGDADILAVDPTNVAALISDGVVPVVAGFQGATASGIPTTIGRGGSDLTAVALACALGGAQLKIYKDVDGICTGDPHRLPGVRTIEHLSLDDLCDIARTGAQIIHEKAAQLARTSGTSLQILGLHSGIGTRIDG